MSGFVPNKLHLREVILHYFLAKKSCTEIHRVLVESYGVHSPSKTSCTEWFQRFRNGDFSVSDKKRDGAPKKFADQELMDLLEEDPCQSLEDLGESLQVDRSTVGKRLHAIGMVQKLGNWVPYELKDRDIERRKTMCELLLQRQKRKSFLHRIITGDEKWIHYDNPKRKAAWVKPGEAGPSTPKRNIHGAKVMLCIWWDMKGVIYYELLNSNETITGARYRTQLMRLKQALAQKRPEWKGLHEKIILLHDNARPHVAVPVKNYLEGINWDILPHPPYSPDIAPSDYYLFRSMQSALSEQRFPTFESIRIWVDLWIASKDQAFFTRGIRSLPERWAKVVASDGAYFE